MNSHRPEDRDHWENLALSMELTIEGQRLIAREIAYELKSLWRWLMVSMARRAPSARRPV